MRKRQCSEEPDWNFDYIWRFDGASADEQRVCPALKYGCITQFDACYERDEMARRVVKRSNARSTGKFPSWKMWRMVEFESLYELAAFIYLECNPAVKRYWAQPCKLQYRDGEEHHLHFPDICVDYGTHLELWEIKPKADLDDPSLIRRTRLLIPSLRERGYIYRVVAGESVTQQPYYNNLKLLRRHRRGNIRLAQYEQIRLVAKQTKALRWSEARAGSYGQNGRALLASLVLSGHLMVDLSRDIATDAQFLLVER